MHPVTVVLIPIVIARIAAGDPPTNAEPPPTAEQEVDPDTPETRAKPVIVPPKIESLPPPAPYVPPPAPCADRVEFYGDVSLWYGITDLHSDGTSGGHNDAGSFPKAPRVSTPSATNRNSRTAL